jgi:protoheme IX farnesyltransferase
MHRFAKYCWFVLVWTILVILWGAFVRASGSGAGCGNHWPTCNGEIIPQPKQIETLIEFTHRLLSGGAFLLIILMFTWGWQISHKGDPLRKGLVASGLFIITELLLGASLVLFGLVTYNQSISRAIVLALHLLNTFFLIGSIALTAWWASGGKPLCLSGLGYLPIFLGIGLAGVAIIGMSGAVTALGDTLFPAQNFAQGLAQDASPNAHFLLHLRVYHPIIAFLVGGYTLYLLRYLRKTNHEKIPQKIGMVLGVLILVQWAAGLINVLLLAPVPMQITHLLIADTIWITYVLLIASILTEDSIQKVPIRK